MNGLGESEMRRDERVRAVRRYAERAARDLDNERSDSVLQLARTFGAIDRDEAAGQFEARLGFLERQVERLVGRRDQVDRAVYGELQLMRTRVGDAIRAIEAAGEEERKARRALESRVRAMIEESDRRSSEAAKAARESLVATWEQTVEVERAGRERERMAALEAELAERTAAARTLIADIRESLEAQVSAAARAARALADSALDGISGLLPPAAVRSAPVQALPAPAERGLGDAEAG
ncbi:MAG: hypothetical protein ACRDJO_06500 [Actinomycetota bacterium]